MCLEYSAKLLKDGHILSIFPEGAYIEDDGNIYKGRTGAARILFSSIGDEFKPSIIPVAIKIDGKIEEVKGLTNIGDKFKSFGFEVLQIDGNNIEELLNAFNVAKQIKGRPTVIIAKTIKGKGVSFMENKVEWHGRAPKEEEYKQAIEELSKKYAM